MNRDFHMKNYQTMSSDKISSNEKSNFKVRCLVQQCQKAKLYTKLADVEQNIKAEFVEVK